MRLLITGGCGFIGTHVARHFLGKKNEVHILDDFSRSGTKRNQAWLETQGRVTAHVADIRDAEGVLGVFKQHGPFDAVIHLAGQVAVTSSVKNPRDDFNINALGTFNILEAVRASSPKAAVLYSSTNKVYGGMEDVQVVETNNRFAYDDLPHGVSEERTLDFHSPYGCSKGAADQYVRDYARIYGLKSVVFRQSCIYGTHQYGIEDQGWVAWFCIAATQGNPLTVYGNGKQVRDVLYVEDLVQAYAAALERIGEVSGQVFNLGGGPAHTLSLLELLALLERRLGKRIPVSFADWRPGDQRVCIMDIRKAQRLLGWSPRTGVEQGVDRLLDWIKRDYRPL
jgi:CDP-paratose 2-epimerase